jgi:hypothetical protein
VGIQDHPTKVTGLLLKWGQGDEAALERFFGGLTVEETASVSTPP